MWLGEQVTERMVLANGISMIILRCASIVAGLPDAVGRTLETSP